MARPVCWIDTIAYTDATPSLQATYDAVAPPTQPIDNLYQAFSLRAHIIKPADDLYKAVLHNDANTIAKVDSELFGCYVAVLTGCDYALAHHGHNFVSLSDDRESAMAVIDALQRNLLDACGCKRQISALGYIRKLTLHPDTIVESDVDALRATGWLDGEILEIAQIVAMFSYFVRVINGVGIQLAGEKIGLY